jgi:hypothetical protein
MGEGWSLESGKDDQLICTSADQVLAELDKLEQFSGQRRPMVLLIAPTGESMTVGIGGATWFLNAFPVEGTPSYSSSNPELAEAPETVQAFDFCGERTEIGSTYMVPKALAQDAIRHFMATRERDPRIAWEED